MPQPIISWYDATNTNQITSWDLGTIDAGKVSSDYKFIIWNNRGGSTDVSKMEDCNISTRDIDGGLGDTPGKIAEVVRDNWIEVKVDSLGESTFTPIGKEFDKPIGAGGDTTNGSGTHTPGTNEILGVANDGTLANSKANFVEVTLRANVPPTASSGETDFHLRVAYRYV